MTTPSINVNLTPCTCPPMDSYTMVSRKGVHFPECPGFPVLIPCPIPRSVTFELTLGDCACFRQNVVGARHLHAHADDCPARIVRVSCSIVGKTWEESAARDVEVPIRSDGRPWTQSAVDTMGQLARERWGFIKSLVLGHSLADCPEPIQNMRAQRDEVFAALADMARTERALGPAHLAMFKALDAAGASYSALGPSTFPDTPYAERGLAAYVEHLIEQVGVLR